MLWLNVDKVKSGKEKNVDVMKKLRLTEDELVKLIKTIIDEKTDYSKEKKSGLHGWFSRQGGKSKRS